MRADAVRTRRTPKMGVERSFVRAAYEFSAARFLTGDGRGAGCGETPVTSMKMPMAAASLQAMARIVPSSTRRIARTRASTWLCALAFLASGVVSGFASEPQPGWWKDAVFYEIFVRSFADASTGPLAGDGIGDFQGLIEKLDHLNDGRGAEGKSLGVTALWLMPIHPSPSYHGYDVSDYFAVHPEFGDIALFKKFLAEAHRRGIRVIIDSVLNHASSQHPLFLEAVAERASGAAEDKQKMFRFSDVPLELFGPWDQRAWHPVPGGRGGFFYGVFSSDMPDWNFNDPRVTEHHRKAAEFWLKDVGVDGFRLDAVRYFHEVGEALQDTDETRAWLKEFTEYCHEVKPGAFVIGENTARMGEVAKGIRGGAVDSSFEFDLARATIEAVRLREPRILSRALGQLDALYAGDAPWATLLTNHDQERARTQLGGSESGTRLATKLLFTLPGVVFTYYGEELGMRATKPDPELRTPMPWTSEPPNAGFAKPNVRAWKAPQPEFREVNVAAQIDRPDSMWALYRKLIALNLDSTALRRGKRLEVSASEPDVYVQLREAADEVVLVIGNLDTEPRRGVALSAAKTPVRANWTMTEEMEEEKVAAPKWTSEGGLQRWQPLGELAPESVYVVRWRK